MSFIVPPPIKIEFPEQLALSNSISGNRVDVAASEKAVNLLREALITGIYPIGCPMPCPFEQPPSDDFFFMKGQAFDGDANPILKGIYGEKLLDMRGKAIVGALDHEKLLSFIENQLKRHGHSGSYVHNTNVGRKYTNTTGNHNHAKSGVVTDHLSNGHIKENRRYRSWSQSNGLPMYDVRSASAGNHSHYIDIGSHSHGVVIAEYGGDRNLIDSYLFNWMVRKG